MSHDIGKTLSFPDSGNSPVAPLEREYPPSFFYNVIWIATLVVVGYALFILFYSAAVFLYYDYGSRSSAGPSEKTLVFQTAVKSTVRETLSAYSDKLPWPDGVMKAKIVFNLKARNFLFWHMAIHGLVFVGLGILAGKRRLFAANLFVPLILAVTTTRILFNSELLKMCLDWGAPFYAFVLVDCLLIYTTSLSYKIR